MTQGTTPPFVSQQRHGAPVFSSDLEVQVVSTREGLSNLESEYSRLHEASGNVLPFALHEWHLAWWDHFAQASKRIRDSLRIHVVRDRGNPIGLVPLVLTEREFARFTIGTMGLLGADPNVTELRNPLVVPGAEARVVSAVQKRLAKARGWDWSHWSCSEGPLSEALHASAAIDWKEPILDYVLDLAPTWDAFRSGLKRNIRESLRHCYNSLKREGMTFDFEVATTPDDVHRGVETFLRLHGLRAMMTGTVKHPNRFASDVSRRFLVDVCSRMARRGAARVFLLRIRGEVVAARLAFVVGKSLYLYYSGFDPEWAKYGVSTTVMAEAVKYAIALGLSTVNLSTGTDPSKTRWGARPVTFQAGVQTHPQVRSQIAYAAYRRVLENRSRWLEPVIARVPKRFWG
jgi:CelD/BcsL family acetyltransferase involved in cellulose biosynthesis